MTEARRVFSDTRPYDGGKTDERYGRLIELGSDRGYEVEHFYTHIKAGEVLEVVTTRIWWGPNGSESPGNVWRVYWSGEGEAVIEKLRPANLTDYPREHSIHQQRTHDWINCPVCHDREKCPACRGEV